MIVGKCVGIEKLLVFRELFLKPINFGQLVDEAGAMERKRGPKIDSAAAEARRVRELEKEVERLRAKLTKAELIIDVQKKLSTLLGLNTGDMPSEPK